MTSNFMRAIEPKSDQLNAEQLIAGPITITVTSVDYNFDADQKMIIHYQGENGRPYKPCKTMMKLIGSDNAWGPDEQQWAGRSMTLYRDPSVKFGRDETGGIRISHLSHIRGRLAVTLMVRRGQYQKFTVEPLRVEQSNGDPLTEHKNALSLAVGGGAESLRSTWEKIPANLKPQLEAHKDACKKRIIAATENPPWEQPMQNFQPATPEEKQLETQEPPAQTDDQPAPGSTSIENF